MANEMAFFEQAAESGRGQIVSMHPGQADAFFKIVKLMSNYSDTIPIINSNITVAVGDAVITVNLSPILGNNVNLSFFCNEQSKNDSKCIKSNKDVLFLDDVDNNQYIIHNGNIAVKLPKKPFVTPPIVPDLSPDKVNIISQPYTCDDAAIVKQYCNGSKYVDIAVFSDKLGFFARQSGDRYYLGKYSGFQYEKQKPDVLFRSYNLLPIISESVTFQVVQLKNNSNIFYLNSTISFTFGIFFNVYDKVTLFYRR